MEGLDYIDRTLLRGVALFAFSGVFWAYIGLREHYVLPSELLLTTAILSSLFGLHQILKAVYMKWTQPSQLSNREQPAAWNMRGSPYDRFGNNSRVAEGPKYEMQNQSYYDESAKSGIYTNKSFELAEAYVRKQAIKYIENERKPNKPNYEEPTYDFGFRKNYEKQPIYNNPMSVAPQYEPDQGINCRKDQGERINFKSSIFTNLPERTEGYTGYNRLFPRNLNDDYSSRRDSMTRNNDKASTSMNRTPLTNDRTNLSYHRSSSPMQRGDVGGLVSARPLMRKSTVMLKEWAPPYSATDKRSMLNQGNYNKAIDSLIALGGDEVTFNQSIKNLHLWISHKLIDKYYKENQVIVALS